MTNTIVLNLKFAAVIYFNQRWISYWLQKCFPNWQTPSRGVENGGEQRARTPLKFFKGSRVPFCLIKIVLYIEAYVAVNIFYFDRAFIAF